jgi:hypothetical protein
MEPDAIPSAPMETRLCHPVAYGTRLAIPSAPMEPDSTDADVLGDPEATNTNNYVDADDDVDTWRNNVLTRFIMLLRLILWLFLRLLLRLILRLLLRLILWLLLLLWLVVIRGCSCG